jgi:hypothetical protein
MAADNHAPSGKTRRFKRGWLNSAKRSSSWSSGGSTDRRVRLIGDNPNSLQNARMINSA